MTKKRGLFASTVMICFFHAFSAKGAELSKWEKSVVKVTSSPCHLGRPLFEGSGILFVFQKHYYVVTSEHVLIHDSSSQTCLNVSSSELVESSGQLVRADYYAGMALIELKATDRLATLALDWTDIQGDSAVEPGLTAIGFPAGSDQLQTLNQGQLVTSQGHRAFIPGVKNFIEANLLPVEFGMSGGLLISGTEGHFAGMISHQFLKRDPGHSTAVGTVDEEESIRNGDLAIAIPAAEIKTWIESVLSGVGSDNQLIWHRKPESQLNHINEVCYGVLCFSARETSASDLQGIGGRGDGAGVGGDGSGSSPDESAEKLKVIEVHLDPTASAEVRAVSYSNPILEDDRTSLLRGQKVLIGFLKMKSAERLVKLESLDQFLTLWMRDQMIPVATKSRNGDLTKDMADLVQASRLVQNLAQYQKDHSTDANQKSWFALIRDQALMAENSLISAGDLEASFNSTNEVFWRQFYEQDFDHATELEGAIRKLIDKMKKVGLK
jgi:hypothetical protein